MSIKNSDDTIRNRTRDLPACSAVPQPTAPPRAPFSRCNVDKKKHTDRANSIILSLSVGGYLLVVKFTDSSNRQNTTENSVSHNRIISPSQDITVLRPSVFSTGIHRILVIYIRRPGPAERCTMHHYSIPFR
jgi:hypothetical protein